MPPDGEEGLAAVVEAPGGRGPVVAKRVQPFCDGVVEGACRCSESARQQRHAPLDLAKAKGRVRSRRTHGFQRTRSRERRGHDAYNLPRSPSQHSGEIEPSSARESQGLRLGLRVVLWVRWSGIGGGEGVRRGRGGFYLARCSRWSAGAVVAPWAGVGQAGWWRPRAGPRRTRRAWFWRDASVQGHRGEHADRAVTSACTGARQGLLRLTGERAGAAAPVGWWGDAELECMVETDWRCAWGGERERAQIDVAGTGWG
jgi:hypothetical protein